MRTLIFLLWLFPFVILTSCQQNQQDKEANNTQKISDLSIYNLESKWKTQDNKTLTFSDLEGDNLVIVMIYTSCKAACPRLVADMKSINSKLTDSAKKNLKMILISIDPETDTPERLKEFAIENNMTDEEWLFLVGNENDTREFAAVTAVNYKKISPLDFSHSNIISVFDKQGEMIYQKEGLGNSIDEIVAEINNLNK